MSDQNKPHSTPQADELQAQLDALLAQTDEPAPAESAADDAPAPDADPIANLSAAERAEAIDTPSLNTNAPLDRVVDRALEAGLSYDETEAESPSDADDAAAQTPATDNQTPEDTHASEALASQIQSLLDDANDEQATSPDAQADAALNAELEGSFESPEAMDIHVEAQQLESPADLPHEAATHDQAADTETIEQIDQMLADEADDALAGEFATVDDILSSEADAEPASINANAAPIEQPSEDLPQDEFEAAYNAPSESADATKAAASLDEAVEAAFAQGTTSAADLEDEFESEFAHDMQSPEQVLSGASAEDVGAELDDQPEQHALAKEADEAAEQSRSHHEARPAPSKLVVVEQSLRQFCALVNQPLQNRSAEMRQTVGWVGVISLFNGVCLLIYSLLH